ncbi:MAG TPA: hypothetical protein VIL48_15910 [Acidimicrobiales bacterium]
MTVHVDGVAVTGWVVVDEDEHHRRSDSGAVTAIDELAGVPAERVSLRIRGVVVGPGPWRTVAAAVGRATTVAPRVVLLDAQDAVDDLTRAEARIWGVGLVAGDRLIEWPQIPEPETGIYQRWLAEEFYAAWLRGAVTQRSEI